eukprot:5707304-Prymnesium_polylepis.1
MARRSEALRQYVRAGRGDRGSACLSGVACKGARRDHPGPRFSASAHVGLPCLGRGGACLRGRRGACLRGGAVRACAGGAERACAGLRGRCGRLTAWRRPCARPGRTR